ncbi:MAG: TonB-dependent siderophore receptor, partial [Pseudomonadota bacterium]
MSTFSISRALLGGAATTAISLATIGAACAQNVDSTDSSPGYVRDDNIYVEGIRRAFRGEFEQLEIPQAEQNLNLEIIEDIRAFDLVTALDLSASVARQNNFGGLWNAFAVRGFAGDE